MCSDKRCKFPRPDGTLMQVYPGRTTSNILLYIEDGSCRVDFPVVIMNVGTNDLWLNKTEEQVAASLHRTVQIVHKIHELNPAAKVFVSTVLPRPKDWYDGQGKPCSIETIADFNRNLWRNKRDGHYGVISTYKSFDINGQLQLHLYAEDGLHLNQQGKATLSKYFQTTIQYQRKHIAQYFKSA